MAVAVGKAFFIIIIVMSSSMLFFFASLQTDEFSSRKLDETKMVIDYTLNDSEGNIENFNLYVDNGFNEFYVLSFQYQEEPEWFPFLLEWDIEKLPANTTVLESTLILISKFSATIVFSGDFLSFEFETRKTSQIDQWVDRTEYIFRIGMDMSVIEGLIDIVMIVD